MDQPKPEGLLSGVWSPLWYFIGDLNMLESMTIEGDSPVWEVDRNLGNS